MCYGFHRLRLPIEYEKKAGIGLKNLRHVGMLLQLRFREKSQRLLYAGLSHLESLLFPIVELRQAIEALRKIRML